MGPKNQQSSSTMLYQLNRLPLPIMCILSTVFTDNTNHTGIVAAVNVQKNCEMEERLCDPQVCLCFWLSTLYINQRASRGICICLWFNVTNVMTQETLEHICACFIKKYLCLFMVLCNSHYDVRDT